MDQSQPLSTPDQSEQFHQQGYVILPQICSPQTCDDLVHSLSEIAGTRPGTRQLLVHHWCQRLATRLKSHPLIAPLLGPEAVVSQCTYFDKSQQQNWLVALHQDLSIAVQPNSAATQWGMSFKEGMSFIQPPVEVLEQLVVFRIHLDDCTQAHGPLEVVPGSHLYGRLANPKIAELRDTLGEISCQVPRGGGMIMRPLLLHGSSKITLPQHRRVLHFLCGPSQLQQGLVWHQAI